MTKGVVPLEDAAKPAVAIRLAGEKDPAADVYNAYHYLTQLAGLYAQASQVDHHGDAGVFWGELADLTMLDLGELFAVWDVAAKGDRGGAGRPFGVDARLMLAATSACQRAVILIQRLDLWVSMMRWTRVLTLAEKRWQRLAERLAAARPLQAAKLRALHAQSSARLGRLTSQLAAYEAEQQRIQTNYQLATGGSKKKSSL